MELLWEWGLAESQGSAWARAQPWFLVRNSEDDLPWEQQ